jgi:membrane protein implicated in regulation of membrane protease activity
VIGIGTLVQRVRDLGGWFLVAAGVIFLLIYNWQMDIQIISTYILPGLLIVIGINILRKYFRKKS